MCNDILLNVDYVKHHHSGVESVLTSSWYRFQTVWIPVDGPIAGKPVDYR
jgi:hypothetical protein